MVAVLHFIIYAGFIINIEVLEIFLDGVLGTHWRAGGITRLATPAAAGELAGGKFAINDVAKKMPGQCGGFCIHGWLSVR